MRNLAILLALCLLPFIYGHTQQTPQQKIDSLQKWLQEHKNQDTFRIKTLFKLENLYLYNRSSESGKYAREIIQLSKRTGFERGIYRGLAFQIYSLINAGKYKEAAEIAFQKLKYAEKANNTLEKLDTFTQLGQIYSFSESNYKLSLYYYLKAKTEYDIYEKTIPESIKKYQQKVSSICNLGAAYDNLKNHKMALKHYMDAYALFKQKVDNGSQESNYQEMGLLINIGTLYDATNKNEKAVSYYEKALILAQKHNIPSISSRAYVALCEVYTELRQFDKAQKAFVALEKLHSTISFEATDLENLYKHGSMLYAGLGNFEKAYSLSRKHISIRDSLRNVEQNTKINELNTQYETQKKEATIKELQQKNELAEANKRFYFGIILLLTLLVASGGIAIYQIRKALLKSEKATKQRDRLFSIVAHDLRSPVANLQYITSTISHVFKKNDPDSTKLLIHSIEESAVSLYKLVDNLLQWSLIQQEGSFYRPSTFALQPEIEGLIHAFQSRALLKNVQIDFQNDFNTLVHADRMAIQTILRNLLDNAIKFSPKMGTIHINVNETATTTEVRIKDSGKGIPDEILGILFKDDAAEKSRLGTSGEKGTGIGLYVCQELAGMNKAEIKVLESSAKGTTFALIFNHPA